MWGYVIDDPFEDYCGVDLLEPYCSSSCPEDCISGQWENSHWNQGANWIMEHKMTTDNKISIECGKCSAGITLSKLKIKCFL